MKSINLNLSRSIKTTLSLVLLAITFIYFIDPYKVLAAGSSNEDTGIITQSYHYIPVVQSANSTTYFINDTNFTFTSFNRGNIFNIPKACQARMVIGIVAADGAEENLTIKVKNSSGLVEATLTPHTNGAQVITFYVGGGDHYLEYSGRNIKYQVWIQLYTWDY